MSKLAITGGVEFLQAADGESAGGVRKFRIVAYTGAQIRQGWSREPVMIDLAGMTLPATVPIVLGHDYELGSILGQGTPSIQGGQLVIDAEILADSEAARQVVALADRGYQWQASVGADVGRHLRFGEDQATTVNGQTVTGPVRIVRASTLRETSFVTLGADRSTAVSIAADAAEEIDMAADASTNKPTADEVIETPVVAATAETAVETVPAPTPAVVADTSELLAKLDALTQKVETMQKLNATRDERPAAPAVHVVAHVSPSVEVIEASFALQGNLPGIERQYDAKVLEAAHKARREISLGEVMLQAAVANGYDGPRRVNSATLRPILQAAWATHDISNILSATVNKFLLAGFNSVESAWRSISAVRSVNDFKAVSQYRLNGGFKFEKVANGGEIKNAAAKDEVRTIAAETYGIMTSVTRTDLINDDLSALTAVPSRIGRGGALTLNDVFWTNFRDDSAFFTVAKGNKKTSSAALTTGTPALNEALTLYRKLKDRDGNPMATQPRVLLVPVDLEIRAAELMNSIQIVSGATGGNQREPSTNVFAGRYEVVSSTYLTDAADYYLLASPADLPVMEVAFLNGVQSPIVETAEADFNLLGVQMRGYFDFGVAKGEDLAGVKMDV